MATDKNDLLPCPFCGGAARPVKQYDIYCITCNECCATAGFYTSPDLAAEKWNTRQPTNSAH